MPIQSPWVRRLGTIRTGTNDRTLGDRVAADQRRADRLHTTYTAAVGTVSTFSRRAV